MVKYGFVGIGKMATMLISEMSKRNSDSEIYAYDIDAHARKVAEEDLEKKYRNVHIFESGSDVSKMCDATLYFVPIDQMSKAIKDYGKHAKKDSIAISGSSVMSAANEGFEILDKYVDAISAHLLYGPTVNPKNQTTVIVGYKASDKSLDFVKQIFGELGNYTEILPSHNEHDKIMSEVQVATHISSITYGVAVKEAGLTHWKDGTYKDKMQMMKTLLMLRMFGGNPRVYSGIAMINPYGGDVAIQWRKSANEWFKMSQMMEKDKIERRVNEIKAFIFEYIKEPIHLDDPKMGPFRLDNEFAEDSNLSPIVQGDVWFQRGVNPYDNPACRTGYYKLRLGQVEHIFTNRDLLESSLNVLKEGRELNESLAFTMSADAVSTVIENKNAPAFHKMFDDCYRHYENAIPAAMKETDDAIERVSSYGSLVTRLRERLGI